MNVAPLPRQQAQAPMLKLAALREANQALSQPPGPKTEHYVTLFDNRFLPQGLCLYYSLVQHGGDFQLWVVALDQSSFSTLEELNLPRLRPLNLSRLEPPELLAVKPDRNRAEYCWTITPTISKKDFRLLVDLYFLAFRQWCI